MKTLITALTLGLLATNIAHAADTETPPPPETKEIAQPYTYSPDPCEFAVTFPEEPLITNKCTKDGEEEKCYDHVTFTQVYDFSSSVNVKVICNPVDAAVKEHYNGIVMQETLKAMTENAVIQTFDTSFHETEHYKQAGLVGEGKMGKAATIYIAQLWIGNASAFSVEAELIGGENTDAERLFSDILKSVQYKEDHQEQETEE